MDNAQLVNQSSGVVEYITPPKYPAAARQVMGGIDLDPASSHLANAISVGAVMYMTKQHNGLDHSWHGRVWMNHPWQKPEQPCHPTRCTKKICPERGYHNLEYRPGNEDWINHFVAQYTRGNMQQGMCITPASTSEVWFWPLLDYPQCFIRGRVNYLDAQGNETSQMTKGSVVTYLGPNIWSFVEVFSEFGVVKFPAPMIQRMLVRAGGDY